MRTDQILSGIAQIDFVTTNQGGFGKPAHNLAPRIALLRQRRDRCKSRSEYNCITAEISELERGLKLLLESAGQERMF